MRLLRGTMRWAVGALTLLLVTACNGATREMPREYGPLVLAADEKCPLVAGRYFDSSDQITRLLALAHVNDPSADADRAWFELSGEADTALTVTVMYRDSVSTRGRLQKGNPWQGDYFCEDGWLKLGDHRIPRTWDGDVTEAEFYPRRKAFWLAPNADKGLVGRLQFIHYKQFDVWCGDGCKGFPIPGTFKYKESWSLAEPFDPDLPPPVARKREAERQRVLAELEEAKKSRVYQEEQLLENGPPDPERDAVQKRALRSVVEGMLIKGVGRSQGGFNISLEFDELWQLEQFMTRFQGTGPVEEITVAPHYRARTTDGHWTDVVWVRLSP